MARYELNLSPKHVLHWGLCEAVREIFQNAIDQGDWSFKYQNNILKISNSGSLPKKTLLLGESSKTNDPGKIGLYGEGYKNALLILTRLGYRVAIYTRNEKNQPERWIPSFEFSRKFQAKLLIVYSKRLRNIDEEYSTGVHYVIENISQEDWRSIKKTNLHLRKVKSVIQTDFGRILLEKKFKGKVYINGLFVEESDNKKYCYGYDFNPEYISLDRDRRSVGDFDLSWRASQMWDSLGKDYESWIIEMLEEDAPDVKYLDSHWENRSTLSDSSYKKFLQDYGANTVPVKDQYDVEDAKKKYGNDVSTTIVSTSFFNSITRSRSYSSHMANRKIIKLKTPTEELTSFYKAYKNEMSEEMLKAFHILTEKSINWK